MSNISTTNSTYTTGGLDTRSTLDGTSLATFQQMNGAASGVVAIETVLGDGPTLRGNEDSLADRLAVGLTADGKLKVDIDASVDGQLNVPRGGTGVASVTAGAVLAGNGSNDLINSGAGLVYQALISGAGGAPSWAYGLAFTGPGSVGSGSSRSMETFTSGNVNMAGIHFYAGDFTLNNGHTITITSSGRRLVIVADGTITIGGAIAGGSNHGGTTGTDQPGGAGGLGVGAEAGVSSFVLSHGIAIASNGTQVTGSSCPHYLSPWLCLGGAAGGQGGGSTEPGTGGNGGASLVLIAPNIVLLNTANITLTGGAGGAAGAGTGGGGGGGGGGNLYALCHFWTDNGATISLTGGSGGAPNGGGSSTSGGAGATGIKQILIY